MSPALLELRAEIFAAFAATGAPPELPDSADLRALEQRHVVVLDEAARIRMAHPFANHREGARVDAAGARGGATARGTASGSCTRSAWSRRR